MSFADDFMKANAEKRSRAGFDTFIDRQGGGKCCPWCAKLIGHFKYPDNVPKDVYRRHDNCTCTVTYGTKGGARQDVWSKVAWTVPPAKKLHRGAVQGAEKVPHRLTGAANGGIIRLGAKVGGEGVIPLHEEPRYIKTIDLLNRAKIEAELEDFEKWAVKSKVENACVITKDGEVYYCFGVPDGVYPSYDLGDKLYGAIVSHNHPDNETEYSFSGDDYGLFYQYRLIRLRGIDYKYIYELSTEYSDVPPDPTDESPWCSEL